MVGSVPSSPSGPQAEFHEAAAKHTYTFLCGGLGSGKSWAGAWELIWSVLENREVMQDEGRDGELLYLVGAPTYQLIDAGPWRHILTILDEMSRLSGYSIIKGKPQKTHPRQIRLTTGDVIQFISTDSGRFAGANAVGWWLDEGEESENPLASFNLLDNRKRDQRGPRMFGITTSTPTIAGTGIARLFEDQEAAENPDYKMVRAATNSNPAFADGKYYAQRAATMSERERRVKLDGEILPPEGSVFGLEFDPSKSLAHRWRFDRNRKRVQYNLAIDWGGSYHALLIEHDEKTGVDVVMDEFIKDGVQVREFCQYVVDQCKSRWRIDRADIHQVVCDYNPKDSRTEAYKWWRGRVSHRRVRNHQDRTRRLNVMRWRLLDSNGNRRLLFNPALKRTRSNRPVLLCLTNYKFAERRVQGQDVLTDRPIQESLWSHGVDALAYMMDIRYSGLRIHEEVPGDGPGRKPGPQRKV